LLGLPSPVAVYGSSSVLGWVPIMDGWCVFARMLYARKGFYGFEWMLFFAIRVLVVSRMGSQHLGAHESTFPTSRFSVDGTPARINLAGVR
jgi:hypothetical protein